MNLSEAIQRSTRALQPAATTAPAGTLYYVTDESITERSNGTTWDSIADAASVADNSVSTVKVQNDAITYAKIQNVTDVRLLGRAAGSAGDVQELTVGTGLALAAGVLSASGGASDWDTPIVKSGDQSVTNSATLVDVTEFTKAVLINETWLFEFLIVFSGDSSSADFQWALNSSAGTMVGCAIQLGLSTANAAITTPVAFNGIANAGSSNGTDAVDGLRPLWVRAILTFSANCNLTFQFAQNTPTAAKTVKIRLGSIMKFKKVV